MQKLNITLLFFVWIGFNSIHSFSQNLVPNPSFEQSSSCPVGPDELYKAISWNSYKNSPDYMNSCSPGGTGSMSVPTNWSGYQQAASGNAYGAFATYSNTSFNYREFVGNTLSVPLVVGMKYFVSFKVCLTLGAVVDANCATNKIGAMFSTISYSVSNPAPVLNYAHIYTDSIIVDTVNWTRIFGSFVADSAYTNILIGNFFDDLSTDTFRFYTTFSDGAYYLLDDVCVSTDSLYAYEYDYVGLEENIVVDFKLFPNPFDDFVSIERVGSTLPYSVKVYDITGRDLGYYNNIYDKNFKINLNDFENGFFYITIMSNNHFTSYKLLKQ